MDKMDRYLKKSMGFKPNTNYISREGITFLKNLGEYGERSKWISQACELMYDYENRKKGFLIRIIQTNFELCKHLLRVIGRSRKDEF